mgnify:CR=1 FL=1
MKEISLINGPNLNLLGTREPEIYGTETLEQVVSRVEQKAEELGFSLWAFQSNSEGELVDVIQAAADRSSAIIINPAAYTHTSIAILDALKACSFPIIEVHISDISKREDFRKHSYVSSVANEVIAGEGTYGYIRAVELVSALLS